MSRRYITHFYWQLAKELNRCSRVLLHPSRYRSSDHHVIQHPSSESLSELFSADTPCMSVYRSPRSRFLRTWVQVGEPPEVVNLRVSLPASCRCLFFFFFCGFSGAHSQGREGSSRLDFHLRDQNILFILYTYLRERRARRETRHGGHVIAIINKLMVRLSFLLFEFSNSSE